jgi:hypothetical protein
VKQGNQKKGINQDLLFAPSPGPEDLEVSSIENEDCSSLSEKEVSEDSDDSSESPKPKRAKTGHE